MVDNDINLNIEKIAIQIADIAEKSLIEEVKTTPKPGLVDQFSNGAHKDMDINTFMLSANTLKPFFCDMFICGYVCSDNIKKAFINGRKIGLEAEKQMFLATDGVNTHKGALFLLGILCIACGVTYKKQNTIKLKSLIKIEQEMVTDTLRNEIETLNSSVAKTHGDKVYQMLGISGARGEAISGYKLCCDFALPIILDYEKKYSDFEKIKLQALISLMSKVDDINILHRSSPSKLNSVKTMSDKLAKSNLIFSDKGYDMLLDMDKLFIKWNISPGGSADLLCVTLFLYFLYKKFNIF